MDRLRIWLYWEDIKDTEHPAYIGLCCDTIVKHCNSDFKVTLVSPKNLKEYLPELREDLGLLKYIAHKADYIRWKLLEKYGGIWLDIDYIAIKSPKEVYFLLEDYDFLYTGHPFLPNDEICPLIAFLACKKGCSITTKMIDKMDKVIDKAFKDCLDLKWNALGNEILKDVLIDEKNTKYLPLEYFFPVRNFYGKGINVNYFKEGNVNVRDFITNNTCGFMLNNNSYRGKEFYRMTSEQILSDKSLMGELFRYAFEKE